MDDAQRIRLLERVASLEEEELAFRTLLPAWRESRNSAVSSLGVLACGFAFVLSFLLSPGLRAGAVGPAIAAFVIFVVMLVYCWNLLGVLRSKPRICIRGRRGGSLYTLTVPVVQHWSLISTDAPLGWLLRSVDGLLLGVYTPHGDQKFRMLPTQDRGDTAEFDLYISQDFGLHNGVVLIAMRLLGDGPDPIIVSHDEIPSSVYWVSDHRLRSARKANGTLPPLKLVAHDLLYDLVHTIRREQLNPGLESRLRDEINLTERPPA